MTKSRLCRDCEYFDCEGKNQQSLPSDYVGDCLNREGPNFQTGPDETCSFFFPDSIRFPLGKE